MAAGIKEWVSKVLAAVQQQHDMEDLRKLVSQRCSGAGMKAALDHCIPDVDMLQVRPSCTLVFDMKWCPSPMRTCTMPTGVTSDAGAPVSPAACLPSPALRQR